MQENKNENNVNNDEIEIDLVELYGELKKHTKLIAGTTAAFAAAAAIYCFAIAKPIYEYNAFIRFPGNVSGQQINSFMEAIKDDIRPLDQLKDKNNKIVAVSAPRNSNLIKVTCEGDSVENVRAFGDKYMQATLKSINEVIVEKEKQRFSKEVVSIIQKDINYISTKMNESSFTNADADGRLQYLINDIKEREKNQLFIKAELAKDVNVPEKPVKPKKAMTLGIAAFLGLFLSCGYVIAKYLIKK